MKKFTFRKATTMTIPTPTDFDALAQRRSAAATIPDVGALVQVELDRRAAAEVEAANAEQLARLRGGPCAGCGQVLSIVEQLYAQEGGTAAIRGELQPYWRPVEGLQICFQCDELRGTTYTLADLKGAVVHDLLPADEQRYWQHPALAARVRHLPILWSEHPGLPTRDAPGSTVDRFAFVDLTAVMAALAPPQPDYDTGPACPSCGRDDMYVYDPGGATQIFDANGTAVAVGEPARTWCAGCTTRPVSPGQAAARSTTDPGWLGGPLGSLDPRHPAAAS